MPFSVLGIRLLYAKNHFMGGFRYTSEFTVSGGSDIRIFDRLPLTLKKVFLGGFMLLR